MNATDRLVVAVTLACAGVAVLGFLGWVAAMGALVMTALMLTLSIGWGRSLRRPAVAAGLAGCWLLYAGLALGIAALDDPAGSGEQWWGLPRATALLVFALWPCGLLPGALYGAWFTSEALPEDRLQRFLDKHATQDARG